MNLFELLKKNNFNGLSLDLIRRFAIQILNSLLFLGKHSIIHCDIKPENLLLVKPDKTGINLIDFGSSCFIKEQIYTYIQSRFYRAPEIMLGIKYSPAIDIWSFGCVMCELFLGYPVFPGKDEYDQINMIMEFNGIPSIDVLIRGNRSNVFFDDFFRPIFPKESKGKQRKAKSKNLSEILNCKNELFIDFVSKCFEWDPKNRITPSEALVHPWIMEGLNTHLAIEHLKNLGINHQINGNKTKTSRNNNNNNIFQKTEIEVKQKNSNRENLPLRSKDDLNKTMNKPVDNEVKTKTNKILTIKLKKMALSPKYALKLLNQTKNLINKK